MDVSSILSWLQTQPEAAVAFLSMLVSMAALTISARETGKQRRIQNEALKAEVDKSLLDWGQEATEALSAARRLAGDRLGHLADDQAFAARRSEIAARLSALADRGRLFFPNIDPDAKGRQKNRAMQGHRPPILYALIYAYYEVEALDRVTPEEAEDSGAYIFECQRLFISELQCALDPRRRNEIVDRRDHLRENLRSDALARTARLGVEIDARRPGTLVRYDDEGMTQLVSPDERRAILREIQQRRGRDLPEAAE